MSLEKGKISSLQAVLLLAQVVLATAVLTAPSLPIAYAGQDAWLCILLAGVGGLLIACLMVNLSRRFPGETLFEYLEDILGKIPGKIVSFLYLWFFLHIVTVVVREFGALLNPIFLPETPLVVIHILALAPVAYMLWQGLEVMARTNEIFASLLLFGVILVILAAPQIKLTNFLPVLDAGPVPLLKGTLAPLAWFGELITVAVFLPYFNRPRDGYRIAGLAVCMITFMLGLAVFLTIAVFGPYVPASYLFPTFNAVRLIQLANFVERLEILVVVIWVAGGLLKIGAFYWIIVLGAAQTLGLRTYRPLILPVGVIILALSFIFHRNNLEMVRYIGLTWPFYGLTHELLLPLLLFGTALLRGKRRKKK
ncbi:MAG: spore germination protein [Armatimonadetes bacterium]|nr:spore germination protein [Armatimonadota bacterium]